MSVSPFDHPILGGLLGDAEVANTFSAATGIKTMLDFEAALAKAEAKAGVITKQAAAEIARAIASFSPDIDRLRAAVAVDGVVVPELVRQLRDAVGSEAARRVHFGATSQDVIDTSLMLRLKPLLAAIETRLQAFIDALAGIEKRDEHRALMARTRMQAAIPINARDRLDAWRQPAKRNLERLRIWSKEGLALQFGGAAGTLDRLGDKAAEVRAALAAELGLIDAPQWHGQRDRLAELASTLSLVTGGLGKFGQDIALMAQAGDEIELAGGGASSTMPHKQNPVAAEVLVTLARFNATQLAGMHGALVHEQERSGAAWTLEWMIFPQMVAATAAATRLAAALAANITRLGAEQ
ncbi:MULTISPECIES: 3-carboxy-cis,cis-muconate cycloisomerase [Phyllobacteriaceae]|jgi:3-carboxy-cis,cis-muconate cycloisomerase|uniref:3-carboxy-cis,cis-muconate cycloisomerase n=1 Tax=Mesorhizobium hungaricum TaxID=1566387 RepID=A0A1C2DYQ8_9HYPH|nr:MULTISPECIES: 3-carboxy-cis,cis-muconate cycloisomerase [Mesorhizobium]MBN9234694.1 3-carboxy-cis,cis-muconate cycloisomerase [Mesorhizobium sp.]MDQ0328826.1 3-carboxy-cis,cis-muconate cycloisomerase [Mesorhizobium sp. YL-MeA3-2017]OCX19882.1 3-carboxy-cis,cis-muconate cycloisomerase [Mesorhizobium hungaricum]